MPDTTVAAIVTKKGYPNKVLLTRRNVDPFKGQWCLPGGHIDPYEPARDAIIREVKEETGLDFNVHFFGYFDEIIPERNIHAVVLVFAGPGEGDLNYHSTEVTEMAWFPAAQARSLSLAFMHNMILDEYVARTEIDRRL